MKYYDIIRIIIDQMLLLYCIAQHFRAAQFSQIGVFKNFAETNFADHGFN